MTEFKYADRHPDHAYTSCADDQRINAMYCGRCTALELDELQALRAGAGPLAEDTLLRLSWALEEVRRSDVAKRQAEQMKAGAELRKRRMSAGMTIARLAKEIGIAPSMLSDAEHGRIALAAPHAAAAAEFLQRREKLGKVMGEAMFSKVGPKPGKNS